MIHKVYVALLSDGYKPTQILGIFRSEENAKAACMKQPTYMRCEWSADGHNSWHNGSGLYVKVAEFILEN